MCVLAEHLRLGDPKHVFCLLVPQDDIEVVLGIFGKDRQRDVLDDVVKKLL